MRITTVEFMKRMWIWCAVGTAYLGLFGLSGTSGCATIGRQFPVEQVQHLEIGKTTQAEVQLMFGTPWRTGLEDGKLTWTYGHYKYGLFTRAKTRDLVVRFDDQGRVVSYTFNSTENDLPRTR